MALLLQYTMHLLLDFISKVSTKMRVNSEHFNMPAGSDLQPHWSGAHWHGPWDPWSFGTR